tara:strand:+ start:3133 stop:3333 length:201 start_codon:yes stop_codon:yes gene_type:complete
MIERIIWYLLVLDCLGYAIMTATAMYHSKKTHHFWKGIPLHWAFALSYIVFIVWMGSALYRLGILF